VRFVLFYFKVGSQEGVYKQFSYGKFLDFVLMTLYSFIDLVLMTLYVVILLGSNDIIQFY